MINPSRYRIIAIGKVKKEWVQEGINSYSKRLPGLTITELKDSSPNKETKAIRVALKRNEGIIALAEEGQLFRSFDFEGKLNALGSQRFAFIIGGAEGLTNEIKDIAKLQMSLSPMTFPHEIARLVLVEQIYRAYSIAKGSPYHRDTSA